MLVKSNFPRAVVSAGLVLRSSLAEWNVFEFMRTTFDALSSIGAIVVTVTVAYKKGIFVGEHTSQRRSCMIVKKFIILLPYNHCFRRLTNTKTTFVMLVAVAHVLD